MSEKPQLQVPKFIKVKDIETSRSGYNVYVKVVSTEKKIIDTRDGLKIPIVDCVVADETGSAKAFFKGENAQHIEKGNVVAIRNGVKRFIKDHISLEIDLFGRVTLEKDVTVNASEAYNISSVEHKLEDKPRRNQVRNNRGGPRRDNRARGGNDNRR
jgi:ssDNA-binding replication factor A large subunit